jgi:hypothetical protein
MLKNFARMLAVGAFVLAAAIPTTASAAGGGGGVGITVAIGSPITLTDRLLVTVPVTVTCTTQLANPFQFGSIFVSIQQADGRSVSHGSGVLNLPSCPATPQTFNVLVTPDLFPSPSGPFHGGGAIAFAGASACDTLFICIGGSVGPVSVRL